MHKSDCAVHNEPAYPAGPCTCGVDGIEGLVDERMRLHRRLLEIARDNSPHDAQHMAETWAEETYGPDWWRR